MESFTYCNPTKLVFGRDKESTIGCEVAALGKEIRKVLVVYGGQSAVQSGLLDRVHTALTDQNLTVVEKGGVRPNPTVELVREGIELARAEAVDLVLAVGGGSVIDTAKAIAMGVPYEGDVWDFFCGKATVEKALPVATVLTIPAAGSEQSTRVVISNGDTKAGTGAACIRPRVSVINPMLFNSIPQINGMAGIFDMMSHIMERYFTNTDNVEYTSGQAEAALISIKEAALRLTEQYTDYDAWCTIGLAGSFAHNGYFGLGQEEDWACHAIEHALSGWDSTIIHGAGLAVVTPAWMQYVWSRNPARFVRFAQRVFDVPKQENDEATVKLLIAKLTMFLQQLGLPMHLRDLVPDREIPIDEIAAKATQNGPIGNFKKLHAEAVKAILEMARG